MHLAADYGQLEVLEYLVAKGADINAKDKHGISVILAAIWEGHSKCVKFLLDKVNFLNSKKDCFLTEPSFHTGEPRFKLSFSISLVCYLHKHFLWPDEESMILNFRPHFKPQIMDNKILEGQGRGNLMDLPHPFFLKKSLFYKLCAWQAPNNAKPFSFRNFVVHYQGFKMRYCLFLYYK